MGLTVIDEDNRLSGGPHSLLVVDIKFTSSHAFPTTGIGTKKLLAFVEPFDIRLDFRGSLVRDNG